MTRCAFVSVSVLIVSLAPVAYAGTVHFNPPSATITPGTQSVSFDVSVSWETLPTIDTVNVLVQANEGVSLEFDYAQAFVSSATIIPDDSGCYDCDQFPWPWPPHVEFGGNNFSAAPWTSPLLIGTLTVDTSGLHASDQIVVVVDSVWESDLIGAPISLVANGVNQEALAGGTVINVIPEPGTLSALLVLTCVARCRRKQVFV